MAKQLLFLTRDTQANKEEIKEIRRELAALRKEFDAVVVAMEHERDLAARDRENLLLRLQLARERFERRLPAEGGGAAGL